MTRTVWKPLMAQGWAVFGAPAAWSLQLLTGYALTAYACYPRHLWRPAFAPGWEAVRGLSLGVNLAALAAAVGAGWLAHSVWRSSERARRFIGLCGMIASGAFALAIAANTVVLIGAPAC